MSSSLFELLIDSAWTSGISWEKEFDATFELGIEYGIRSPRGCVASILHRELQSAQKPFSFLTRRCDKPPGLCAQLLYRFDLDTTQ